MRRPECEMIRHAIIKQKVDGAEQNDAQAVVHVEVPHLTLQACA